MQIFRIFLNNVVPPGPKSHSLLGHTVDKNPNLTLGSPSASPPARGCCAAPWWTGCGVGHQRNRSFGWCCTCCGADGRCRRWRTQRRCRRRSGGSCTGAAFWRGGSRPPCWSGCPPCRSAVEIGVNKKWESET